ncbi:DUF4132 domain-containing protein [Endozoicomonadaceae bacterium StTr2]
MLDKLIKRLTGGKEEAAKVAEPLDERFDKLVAEIEQDILQEHRNIWLGSRLPFNQSPAYTTLKGLKGQDKVDLVIYLSLRCNALEHQEQNVSWYNQDPRYQFSCSLLDAIMRTKLSFPESFSFLSLFDLFYGHYDHKNPRVSLGLRPFTALVSQIEKHAKAQGFSDQLQSDINIILEHPLTRPWLEGGRNHYGPDVGKAAGKLQRLLSEAGGDVQVPKYELGSGRLGRIISASLEHCTAEQWNHWNQLFHHLATASGSKPSKKFMDTSRTLTDAIGIRAFKTVSQHWLKHALEQAIEETRTTTQHGTHQYTYSTYTWIEDYIYSLMRGLLWSLGRFHDGTTLDLMARFTEKCFQKIPGQGPAAASIGNAGIYTLAHTKGLDGISHLSRLKLRIRQSNTQKLIQKYIDEQAVRQGITPAQVEELAAPDFGLTLGSRTEAFKDYQLVLTVTSVGTVEQQWLKPDGKPQKTVPAFVRESSPLSDKLKKMRELVKQIKQASTTQRDRIDRLFTEDMSWSLADFERHYLNHGLVSTIARKLIWTLDDTSALFVDNSWQNVNGNVLKVNAETCIRLWHPVASTAEQTLAWRDRLEQLEIRQPLKQAYREVYLLTDAEVTTRIYSNRMAAHILKQHQFNSLAALRGWRYSLLGAYDDGRNGEIACKPLPAFGLEAQFWINEILDDNDSFNDAGIWYYVATDQVRFIDKDGEPVELAQIPVLALSEIMRDVDLFVGVASVGNDPMWQDGGPNARPDYRDYWHSYSFGDLTEIAKTRKAVLERLLPRLKLKKVATIDGKFLKVQGKRHLYKIHIGSGNILIAPNDRYLCIVPGRGKDKKVDQVFLPFEGDTGLSIVLSKAFLLMDDDRITDKTILQQL